jgi:hypothetical protein
MSIASIANTVTTTKNNGLQALETACIDIDNGGDAGAFTAEVTKCNLRLKAADDTNEQSKKSLGQF